VHQSAAEHGPRTSNRYAVLAVCAGLLVLTAIVFGATVRHGFVNYDDEQYVVENPQVARGLTVEGLRWAFTRSHASNWHPLTWLSHMADVALYGVTHPGGHHLTSVLLHAATAVILFLVLLKATGALWPSALVSALFAVHPLHVESVAWVAERKDVLSGLFFVLTLAAYVGYVRRPSISRYLLVAGFFTLGLLSKPMLVTLPFVLLLLDYWPLERFSNATTSNASPGGNKGRVAVVKRLVMEKLPLFAVAVASAVVTYAVQESARGSMSHLTAVSRVANALDSYAAYLWKFVYPVQLAVFYPHPGDALPFWRIVAACLVLGVISAAALAWRQQHPYLLVGWLWYLGMLVPVIGFVQVGSQAMADRYTYLTQIGLYIAVAWGAVHVVGTSSLRHRMCGVISCVVVVILSAGAWRQVSYWKDSETLWTHALAVTSRNHEAHNHLARALAERGEIDAAVTHYRQALEIRPDLVEAHNNLGNVLAARGDNAAAVAHYRTALNIKPDYVEARNNLGLALADEGQLDAAITEYRRALALDPDAAAAHYNLGNALAARDEIDAAIAHYEKALDVRPDFAEVHNNFGTLLAARGQADAAIAHYRRALAINPQFASARRNLALVLAERKGS
jgi:protein O-mannosyl-transferase